MRTALVSQELKKKLRLGRKDAGQTTDSFIFEFGVKKSNMLLDYQDLREFPLLVIYVIHMGHRAQDGKKLTK